MKYSTSITIRFFAFALSQYVQMSEASVVYYVLPTEPLDSCPRNISCRPNQLCYTMDYLAAHSSELFSPDYHNITLMYMCGVHNYTRDLNVQNVHSFVMKGETGANENSVISMLSQVKFQENVHSVCTYIYFGNTRFVEISALTLHCPSIDVVGGFLTIENSILYGHKSTSKTWSTITITDRNAGAHLDKCTFKQNCFVVSNNTKGIIVNNSTFQSYCHESGSVLVAYSSVVTLTGFINISDVATGIYYGNYSSGAAIFLRTITPKFPSILKIAKDANVCFINSSCSVGGGAVYVENGAVTIDAGSTVIFLKNKASSLGGAMCLNNSTLNISNSNILFAYNSGFGYGGGAIGLRNGHVNINAGARVTFSHNTASSRGGALFVSFGTLTFSADASVNFSNNAATYASGGAVYLYNASLNVGGKILFYNNTAVSGGAIHFYHGQLYIYSCTLVQFITNAAHLQGGAIFIEIGDHSSIITVGIFSKLIFANNSAYRGGAIYVIPSSLAVEVRLGSSTDFVHNTATDVGGAVYSDVESALPCLFLITDYSAKIAFTENRANSSIGQHIYGSSIRQAECDSSHLSLANVHAKPYTNCDTSAYGHANFTFNPSLKEIMSPVSSAPWRVCLCSTNGRQQCANLSQIFKSVSVYRGETFTLSATIVGYDFGTTIGSVYSDFLYSNQSSKLEHSQYSQLISSSETCTYLNYTIYTRLDIALLQLQTSILPSSVYANKGNANYYGYYKDKITSSISYYDDSHGKFGCIVKDLLTTPIIINVTLLPGCPPGLTLRDNLTRCSCYSILDSNGFQCSIRNKTGYLQWNTALWVNATYKETDSQSNGIIYNPHCPLHYCKAGDKMLRIKEDSNKQCASNRTGILCGACMDGFSLAIGSSQCIKCHNSHNLSLLLVFAIAGVLLVFLILSLNLTVTQGHINGLIFYANIIWAYEVIVFPSAKAQDKRIFFLQIFVAWLNLDFGIETCFFVGLNAYWKTWLQFLFPVYIWAIAGAIIVACRYSSRLTNLIGSRAVPLLATLFLLSYMKLLRTIADASSVAVITHYPQNISYTVWYIDGNLHYCQHPHIYLFIAATITLVFLWLPYTLLLVFVQPLRRVSHLRLLRWIDRLAPVYDAYFSPLKNKHQYWFGTMLLVRGILLIIMTINPATNPEFTMFILSIIIIVLTIIASIKNVHKQMSVRVLEGAVYMNLLILSTGTLYKWESTTAKTTLLAVSIGFAFTQFCFIVVWSLIKNLCALYWKCRSSQTYTAFDEDDFAHERIEDPGLEGMRVVLPTKDIATLTY